MSRAKERGGRTTDPDESALRALLGTGRTALTGDKALRAREVSRPGPDDIAAAEAELVIRRARVLER